MMQDKERAALFNVIRQYLKIAKSVMFTVDRKKHEAKLVIRYKTTEEQLDEKG